MLAKLMFKYKLKQTYISIFIPKIYVYLIINMYDYINIFKVL